jgi:hypothetical protein
MKQYNFNKQMIMDASVYQVKTEWLQQTIKLFVKK